jgi:hypothetical protein
VNQIAEEIEIESVIVRAAVGRMPTEQPAGSGRYV